MVDTDYNKTVFISYHRKYLRDKAERVYEDLSSNGYHVFLDVVGLGSGAWWEKIQAAIESSRYFVLLLTHGSIEMLVESENWVRQEIKHAKKHNRVIVPVCFDPLSKSQANENIAKFDLPKEIKELVSQNMLYVPEDYFACSMDKLRDTFLTPEQGADVEITPAPQTVQIFFNEQKEKLERFDTVVVRVELDDMPKFLEGKRWYGTRIAESRYTKIKYIAAFDAGKRAITHYAGVKDIKPWRDGAGENITFDGEVHTFQNPVEWKPDGKTDAVRTVIYTTLDKIRKVKTLDELRDPNN